MRKTATAIIAMTLFAGIVMMMPRIARGQESRGTIVGTVTDASGGAIPEATVEITNTATNVSAAVTTNMSGNFRVPYLLSGPYTVKVSMGDLRIMSAAVSSCASPTRWS